MPSLLRSFFNANIAISKRIERLFPQYKIKLQERFEEDISHCLEAMNEATVLDIGGGRSSRLLKSLIKKSPSNVIAVDISPQELALNDTANFKVCADASRGLPFADNSVQVITSRFLVEHIEDTERFIAESARVTNSHGSAFHLVAAPYSPFATLGKLLPLKWSRKLIARIYPAQIGILGYAVHYNRCSFGQFTKLLDTYGFTVENTTCSYHQSAYLYACFPLFLLSACYDACIHMLGLRMLCAAFYVRAAVSKHAE